MVAPQPWPRKADADRQRPARLNSCPMSVRAYVHVQLILFAFSHVAHGSQWDCATVNQRPRDHVAKSRVISEPPADVPRQLTLYMGVHSLNFTSQ